MNLSTILQLARAIDPEDPRLEMSELPSGYYVHAGRKNGYGASLDEALTMLGRRLQREATRRAEKLQQALGGGVEAPAVRGDVPSFEDT